jgi:heat shock protein HslJ
MSESPTRAIVVREWFKVLQARIPEAKAPTSVVGLAANEPVTACRIAASGPATPGLGQTANVAVVIVSAAGIEEVVRVDSSVFEVYLPDNYMADVTDSYVTPGRGPNWPIVAIPGTKNNELAVINSISASAFESATEMLAFGPYSPDSPGSSRSERLVLGDSCGRAAVQVGLQNAKIRIVEGALNPPVCKGSPLRFLLGQSPEFTVTETSLVLSSGDTRIELARSKVPVFQLTKLLGVKGPGVINRVAVGFTLGEGGLRGLSSSDGCNAISSRMAFSANRFVLDSELMMTLRGCRKQTVTAFGPFHANSTGMGTWELVKGVMTLRFMDGMTAVFETKR